MHIKRADVTEILKTGHGKGGDSIYFLVMCLHMLPFSFSLVFFFLLAFEENTRKEMVKATYIKKFRLPEWDQVPETDVNGSVVLWELL